MTKIEWTEGSSGWKAEYKKLTLRVIRGDTGRWWWSIWEGNKELAMDFSWDVEKAKKSAVKAL